MLIQQYCNLVDQQVEFQIIDRMNFKKYLGLESGGEVTDKKTFRAFREKLTQMRKVEDLFIKSGFTWETKGWNLVKVK